MSGVQMELGGKDVCIICDDADLDLAAKNIIKGGFSYSGQRCTAVKIVSRPACSPCWLPPSYLCAAKWLLLGALQSGCCCCSHSHLLARPIMVANNSARKAGDPASRGVQQRHMQQQAEKCVFKKRVLCGYTPCCDVPWPCHNEQLRGGCMRWGRCWWWRAWRMSWWPRCARAWRPSLWASPRCALSVHKVPCSQHSWLDPDMLSTARDASVVY